LCGSSPQEGRRGEEGDERWTREREIKKGGITPFLLEKCQKNEYELAHNRS